MIDYQKYTANDKLLRNDEDGEIRYLLNTLILFIPILVSCLSPLLLIMMIMVILIIEVFGLRTERERNSNLQYFEVRRAEQRRSPSSPILLHFRYSSVDDVF